MIGCDGHRACTGRIPPGVDRTDITAVDRPAVTLIHAGVAAHRVLVDDITGGDLGIIPVNQWINDASPAGSDKGDIKSIVIVFDIVKRKICQTIDILHVHLDRCAVRNCSSDVVKAVPQNIIFSGNYVGCDLLVHIGNRKIKHDLDFASFVYPDFDDLIATAGRCSGDELRWLRHDTINAVGKWSRICAGMVRIA